MVLTLGFFLLAGCTPDEPDEVSTAGVLTAEDLGAGDWHGPFAEAVDTGVDGRNLTCGMLNAATVDSSGRPVTGEAEVFWADGQTLVSSTSWSFDGAVVVVQERNERGGTYWVIDVGVAGTDDAVVAVEVSYPEGTSGVPDIRKLLAAALKASAARQ